MNEKDIIRLIREEQSGYTLQDVTRIVRSYHDIVAEALCNDDTVKISDMYKLYVKSCKGRVGRDPRIPGSKLIVPPTKRLRAQLGKRLEERLNNGRIRSTRPVA